MRYRFVAEYAGAFAVSALCRVMQVSRSGYYAFRERPPSARTKSDATLTGQIREAFASSRGTYGSPRVHQALSQSGIVCGENRVARLMRAAGIRPEPARRFVRTTDSDHGLPLFENRLDRDFAPEAAGEVNRRWVSDITYIWTGEGWLYLAVILDLFSRRVVGWSLAPTLHKEIVLDALSMAVSLRQPGEGLLHHSDRGSQYASLAFQETLLAAGMVCSMSRRGNCWDNAVAESFFATLKRELIHRQSFPTREAARGAVFEYVEVWYNRKRLHSALGYLSPEGFEREHQEKMREKASLA